MTEIESVDAMDGVAVIQAGAILQSVQEQLADQGFLFPLDLGARGSCMIGGNVATNAGGINVLRFGMIRNLVLGLEAVLAGTLSAFEVMWNSYFTTVTVDAVVPKSQAERDALSLVFGHIADGNLHIFVAPFDDGNHHQRCDKIVYGCLDGLHGSISAEHGIGIEKKAWLGQSRSGAEVDMMKRLIKLFDPKCLLNPGKVID